MKQRLPYLAFAVTLVLFLFMVWHYAADAPAKMVGHFNEAGKPSGKMPSDEFFAWMLGIGLSIPLILIVLLYPIRFMSPKLLNSPHPEYWRKPENFRRACDFMFRTSFWFSAAFLVWTTGLLCLVVAANLERPPRLNGVGLIALTVLLIVASTVWTMFLLRYFTRIPPAEDKS
ncbi:MAG: hypothetical protein P1U58_00500 [Verrucomicrobiales bacterium]|nr:hypothetical protein [Verrucomicrobiales bacterium]